METRHAATESAVQLEHLTHTNISGNVLEYLTCASQHAKMIDNGKELHDRNGGKTNYSSTQVDTTHRLKTQWTPIPVCCKEEGSEDDLVLHSISLSTGHRNQRGNYQQARQENGCFEQIIKATPRLENVWRPLTEWHDLSQTVRYSLFVFNYTLLRNIRQGVTGQWEADGRVLPKMGIPLSISIPGKAGMAV